LPRCLSIARRAGRGGTRRAGRALVHPEGDDQIPAFLRIERQHEMRDALLGRRRGDHGRQGEIHEQRPQPGIGAFIRKAQCRPVPFRREHLSASAHGRATEDEHGVERCRQFQRDRQRQLLAAEVPDADRVDEHGAVVEDKERPFQAERVVRDGLAVSGREMMIGQADLRRDPFLVGRHEQQGRRAVQAQQVIREIACVAIEQAESRYVLDDRAVLAGQQHEVVRLHQQRMSDID
jgi:hypothetical protein